MRAVIVAAALLAGGAALAHHGWGSYDAQNPITITGPVKTLDFANPHVQIRIDHQGKTWDLTLAPPFRMQARGVLSEVIAVGAPVTAYGYPSRVNATEMRAEWLEANGARFQLR